ncbi:MAG: inositol 2-dehydrogenase [Saprospiraceae bacterium]|nr:inositol 2-dehydrogenase [Saprospiraceae bacterium]
MKIGLIGLGRIGKLYAEILLKNFDEIEVCAFSPRLQKRFYDLTHISRFKFFSSWNSFIGDHSIIGYIIAAPSTTHYEYIKKLIKFGKPIFCEKPLDLSLKRIDKIHELTKDSGFPITIGFNRRFDPDIRQLKKEIQTGTIGTPHIVKITSRDPAPPSIEFLRSSGGLFLDMVIHDFDMARFLLDEEPISIYSEAEVLIDQEIGKIGDFDTAISTLKFPKGTMVVIDNSRRSVYGYDQRIEVFGSKGMITTKNQRDHSVIKYDHKGSHMTPLKDFFIERYYQSYVNEMTEFLKICQGDKGQIVTVNDARQATKIALAAMKSIKNQRQNLIQ